MKKLEVPHMYIDDKSVLSNNFYDDVNAGWAAHTTEWTKNNVYNGVGSMGFTSLGGPIDPETGMVVKEYTPYFDSPGAAAGNMISHLFNGDGLTNTDTYTVNTGKTIGGIKKEEFDEADKKQATN
jgi:hypothetical protein